MGVGWVGVCGTYVIRSRAPFRPQAQGTWVYIRVELKRLMKRQIELSIKARARIARSIGWSLAGAVSIRAGIVMVKSSAALVPTTPCTPLTLST